MKQEFRYQAGVCNIGTQNRRFRLACGAATFGLVVFLRWVVMASSPRLWRLALLPLLFLGFLSVLQAKARFCVVHGLKGTYHSDDSLGVVKGDELKILDRLRSKSILIQALFWAISLQGLLLAF